MLKGIIVALADFSVQSLLAAGAHANLSRAFAAVFERISDPALFKLVKYPLHLLLNNAVLFAGSHEQLLRLKLKAVDLSDLLRAVTLREVQVAITYTRLPGCILLGESFDCLVHEFEVFVLDFEERLRVELLVFPQVIQVVYKVVHALGREQRP